LIGSLSLLFVICAVYVLITGNTITVAVASDAFWVTPPISEDTVYKLVGGSGDSGLFTSCSREAHI